jgi:hypothetical protein
VDDYRNLLARAACIGPLTPERWALARQYAYSLFIERQSRSHCSRSQSLWWNLQHEQQARSAAAGAEPFLDFYLRARD